MMTTVQGCVISKRTAVYHKLQTKIKLLPLIVLQTILLGARKWKGLNTPCPFYDNSNSTPREGVRLNLP